MSQNKPVSVLVTYRLKKGAEAQFLPLLKKHWPTLDRLGLVSKEKPKIWRAENTRSPGSISYVELMQWKDASCPDVAHQTPDVMKVWEPMGPLLDSMEILNVEPAEL